MSDSFRGRQFAIVLVLAGLIVVFAGLFLVQHLGHIYRKVDIAYRQSEQTFYDWLEGEARKHGLKSDFLANSIAQRLLMMAITDRRDAINSMMIDVFWDELAPPGTDRRPIFTLMTKATRIALASSPLSGELWLFAGWLRVMTHGLDGKASEFIVLSQRFTPRESALVLQRLDLAVRLDQALSPEVAAAMKADLSVVKNINLSLAEHYAKHLQQ